MTAKVVAGGYTTVTRGRGVFGRGNCCGEIFVFQIGAEFSPIIFCAMWAISCSLGRRLTVFSVGRYWCPCIACHDALAGVCCVHSVLSYCRPMYQFSTRVSKPTQNVVVLGDQVKSVAPKGKGQGKSRSSYETLAQLVSAGKRGGSVQFMHAGLKSCKLLWGDECPLQSALKEWATKCAEQGHINPLGHPRTLQEDEITALVQYFSTI